MAPRKTRTAAADPAAQTTDTTGEGGPADTGAASDATPTPAPAAPLTPLDPDDATAAAPTAPLDPEKLAPGATTTAQAAPLEPPSAPLAPPEPTGPPVQINMIATPGSEFVDLVWPDGTPADPDELFTDPGAHFTYVNVAKPIIRRHFLPGALRPTEQLLFPAGWSLPRDHAAKVQTDLRAQREAATAAKPAD
ncbi:hypothetical protein ACIHFD_49370 [Nonomuraea sp. NPDC051941]|uniref:hypothetical protein n=1 Tax=Nonomuraea sp. NPDC051941 TaxID=3364373 RepID=UPI0037C955D5